MMQILWLSIGKRIFRSFCHSIKMCDPYAKFSDHDHDVFARAKRDFSFYSPFVDFSRKRILDVGSGLGKKTTFFSMQDAWAVGMEICKESAKASYRFVKERGLEKADFVVGDATALPFKTESFEIVTSNDALEHFEHWCSAVLEMERVVQESGHVCINFGPLWLSPFGSHMDFDEDFSPPWGHLIFSEGTIKEVLIHFGKIKETERDKPLFMNHLNRVTVKEFIQMLERTGLKILFIRLRTVPPFTLLLKTPFREYFTTGVVAVCQRVPTVDVSS